MPQIIASGACPTRFRARCLEAQEGDLTFELVGRRFASDLVRLGPDEMGDHEWAEELAGLADLLVARQPDEALAWLDARLPRCMAEVPAEERGKFIGGLLLAVTEDEVDITTG